MGERGKKGFDVFWENKSTYLKPSGLTPPVDSKKLFLYERATTSSKSSSGQVEVDKVN